MSKIIAAFIAGLLLASTGTGLAYSTYWKRAGGTYFCSGIRSGVSCKETNWRPGYSIYLIPGQVSVDFGGQVVMACDRGTRPEYNCQSFVPGP